MSAFKNLLSPLQIGGLRLPNRVIMAPMGTEMGTEDGRSTPREAAYYAARAAGGTALVMTGVNFIQSDLEPIAAGLARADTDAHTPGLAGIADAVHAAGGDRKSVGEGKGGEAAGRGLREGGNEGRRA